MFLLINTYIILQISGLKMVKGWKIVKLLMQIASSTYCTVHLIIVLSKIWHILRQKVDTDIHEYHYFLFYTQMHTLKHRKQLRWQIAHLCFFGVKSLNATQYR